MERVSETGRIMDGVAASLITKCKTVSQIVGKGIQQLAIHSPAPL